MTPTRPNNRPKQKPRPRAEQSTTHQTATQNKAKAKPTTSQDQAKKVEQQVLTSGRRPTKFEKVKKFFSRRANISEITREPTAGGMIFRTNPEKTDIEVLLIQDAKKRWTIPKGHIELNETPKETALREIGEEVGLKKISILGWLGKVEFQYRRENRLVLMSMHIYLVRHEDRSEKVRPESWIKRAEWFPFAEAIDKIEYDDIAKMMLLGRNKLRTGEYE